jgi:Ca-activated chloride channel family protein
VFRGSAQDETVRYTGKYTGDPASEMSMEDLLKALSDYLLDSGFQNPFPEFQDLDRDTMDDLREALRRALEQGTRFDESLQQKIDLLAAEGKLDELIEKLIQRMERENYISTEQSQNQADTSAGFGDGGGQTDARFEVTDKSLDFLGFKTLARSAGLAGQGELWTARYAALGHGREASGASQPYEFGDTLNLDTPATLSVGDRARGADAAAESRIQRFAGASERVSELVRDSGDAGLLALDDSCMARIGSRRRRRWRWRWRI